MGRNSQTDLRAVKDEMLLPLQVTARAVAIVAVAAVFFAATETIRATDAVAVPIWRAAIQNFPWWLLWIAFTPIIARVLHAASIRRFGTAVAVLVHIPVAIVVAVVHLVLVAALMFPLRLQPEQYPTVASLWRGLMQGYVLLDVVTYGAIAGLIVALDSRSHLLAREREGAELALQAERLERDVAEARLDSLQRQLNPHYLFNCLNAIAGLARQQRHEEVVAMTAALGGFLRETLALEGRRFITLREELRLAQQYLALERIRFGDRVRIEIDIPTELADRTMVPPLLLQPLLENACRHGMSDPAASGFVSLSADADGAHAVIRIGNSVAHRPDTPARSGGIGLKNTRERLVTAYGSGAASLTVLLDPPTNALVEIRVPVRST